MPINKKTFLSVVSLTLSVSTVFLLAYIYIEKLVINPLFRVDVSGSGSMAPTFAKSSPDEVVASPLVLSYPNGINILNKRYFKHYIGRGDIISFSNLATANITKNNTGEETGFIKRVIGTPGDILEVRDGLVYINGEPTKEPYTYLPHSTFGGSFLKECQSIVIPQDRYFVMGDNRKESNDSRYEVGFVQEAEINGVITLKMQKEAGLTQNWRDTTSDLDASTKIKLNREKFVELLNVQRLSKDLKKLTYRQPLEVSAAIRAQSVAKTGDFGSEGGEDGTSLAAALKEAGYRNIIWGEVPIQGYYNEDELLAYMLEFEESRNFVLNPEYQDIGISVLEADINECPTQIIMIHVGGYVPPNYSQDIKDSWQSLLSNLNKVEPGWADLKKVPSIYKEYKSEIDQILEIITTRKNRVAEILFYLNKNEWLPDDLENYARVTDQELHAVQAELSDKVNGQD